MLLDYWRFALANPRFLGFGFMLTFLSSGGQTYFIGVFGPQIQLEFGLDTGSWGRVYMAGTLMSALLINWSGSLIDRYDLRIFAGTCLVGLSFACFFITQISSVLLLVIAIFLLRQFGQGLTSHAGVTSMARYYDVDRGKAIALASMGYSLGEAILPVLGTYGSQTIGWRATFGYVSLAVLLSILIVMWLLKGQTLRDSNHRQKMEEDTARGDSVVSYTRRNMLGESKFYLMLPAMISTPMIGTAMFFFPSEIATSKGWSSLWLTGNYWLYSIVTVLTTICSGMMIDRFTARRVVPLFLVPLAAAMIVINLSDSKWIALLYLAFLGMNSGMYFTGVSALWAELYGPRYLGSIKAFTNAIMVFSSALGPALVGTLMEWDVAFMHISFGLAGLSLVATALLVFALRFPVKIN
jgi:predicted MFS family arabinose efflux permease